MADLRPGSRVLEIGCGTGQATVPLASIGAAVTAVELSPALGEVAARNLAGLPRATVEVCAFEAWPLPSQPFDLVLSATAFHWIDPAVRVGKSAEALRAGGALAVVSTHHVAGGTEPFFDVVQGCYERFDPATEPGLRLEPADAIPTGADELERSGFFEPVEIRRYEWNADYTTAEYLDLLCTYSGHRALPADARAGLLGSIAELIDTEFAGRITKRYLTELALARRRR